ncbi:MAG: hypothetical protein M1827_003824 [Pycnora praestabilis]|nr:MAG: hypothetical protein M1827_003824 [Pycnora praestabilis]
MCVYRYLYFGDCWHQELVLSDYCINAVVRSVPPKADQRGFNQDNAQENPGLPRSPPSTHSAKLLESILANTLEIPSPKVPESLYLNCQRISPIQKQLAYKTSPADDGKVPDYQILAASFIFALRRQKLGFGQWPSGLRVGRHLSGAHSEAIAAIRDNDRGHKLGGSPRWISERSVQEVSGRLRAEISGPRFHDVEESSGIPVEKCIFTSLTINSLPEPYVYRATTENASNGVYVIRSSSNTSHTLSIRLTSPSTDLRDEEIQDEGSSNAPKDVFNTMLGTQSTIAFSGTRNAKSPFPAKEYLYSQTPLPRSRVLESNDPIIAHESFHSEVPTSSKPLDPSANFALPTFDLKCTQQPTQLTWADRLRKSLETVQPQVPLQEQEGSDMKTKSEPLSEDWPEVPLEEQFAFKEKVKRKRKPLPVDWPAIPLGDRLKVDVAEPSNAQSLGNRYPTSGKERQAKKKEEADVQLSAASSTILRTSEAKQGISPVDEKAFEAVNGWIDPPIIDDHITKGLRDRHTSAASLQPGQNPKVSAQSDTASHSQESAKQLLYEETPIRALNKKQGDNSAGNRDSAITVLSKGRNSERLPVATESVPKKIETSQKGKPASKVPKMVRKPDYPPDDHKALRKFALSQEKFWDRVPLPEIRGDLKLAIGGVQRPNTSEALTNNSSLDVPFLSAPQSPEGSHRGEVFEQAMSVSSPGAYFSAIKNIDQSDISVDEHPIFRLEPRYGKSPYKSAPRANGSSPTPTSMPQSLVPDRTEFRRIVPSVERGSRSIFALPFGNQFYEIEQELMKRQAKPNKEMNANYYSRSSRTSTAFISIGDKTEDQNPEATSSSFRQLLRSTQRLEHSIAVLKAQLQAGRFGSKWFKQGCEIGDSAINPLKDILENAETSTEHKIGQAFQAPTPAKSPIGKEDIAGPSQAVASTTQRQANFRPRGKDQRLAGRQHQSKGNIRIYDPRDLRHPADLSNKSPDLEAATYDSRIEVPPEFYRNGHGTAFPPQQPTPLSSPAYSIVQQYLPHGTPTTMVKWQRSRIPRVWLQAGLRDQPTFLSQAFAESTQAMRDYMSCAITEVFSRSSVHEGSLSASYDSSRPANAMMSAARTYPHSSRDLAEDMVKGSFEATVSPKHLVRDIKPCGLFQVEVAIELANRKCSSCDPDPGDLYYFSTTL